MDTESPPGTAEKAVLDVLSGTPVMQAATRAAMKPTDLADAVELYRAAGRAALEAHTDSQRDWVQLRVLFANWDTAEHVAATRLGPHLQHADNEGTLDGWWFLRKAPCWRLRLHPGPTAADIEKNIATILDDLVADGLVERWWRPAGYEPETLAFGGPAGMRIAHRLFHADSRGILDYLRQLGRATPHEHTLGRRELSLLMCTALFQGAGQDWYERGDIWHRVTRMRPLPPDTPTDRLHAMSDTLRRLMTADTAPGGALFGPSAPLSSVASWAAAVTDAGHHLADAVVVGRLRRGLRDILAHHVIFHWNRLGLSARTQSILARAACDAVMNPAINSPTAAPGGGR
ncbi:thiopeptide-type bacteriocin biosynthesis protein [Streptomyces sp. NBC_01803]|uniref:thiopeptide-type bacteriocin biosynthesis protein n=1 Tax=Streptomyces sp. NBC_01803 TaxID=2975946 RepID=UPI002DDAB9F1|nr:thiopeptide-type bacteriocin biosynthesis protein [Streptomyces sp. NBC_01803]WSA44198.1 thiopeptide-type bacteriocin biosynthesis protein [Streptomyces sp. NBC_01803]